NIRALLLQDKDAEESLLIGACSADDFELRRLALSHPNTPKSFLTLLHRAGASNDLFWFQAPDTNLTQVERLKILASPQMGSYLREIIARDPSCPAEQLDLLLSPIELG